MNTPRIPAEAKPPRMERLARLPVFFGLSGKRVVVAGGTAAAAWKAELLSAAGADVDVFAHEMSDEMVALAASPPGGAVVLNRRAWTHDDLCRRGIGHRRAERRPRRIALRGGGARAGVPVNVIDKPAFCDFSFGSIVNRSPLVIGISTDGAAPVFAQAIRAKLEALIPFGFARWADAARRWRDAVMSSDLPSAARRRFWQLFTATALSDPNREPAQSDYDRLLAETQDEGAKTRPWFGHAGRRRPRRSGIADAARGARAAIGRRHPH